MKPQHWSAEEWAAYVAQQGQPTAMAAQVHILDLDMRPLTQVPAAGLAEGQWNLVDGGDSDRTFQATLVDFDRAFAEHLDEQAAPKRLLQVRQGCRLDALDRWVWLDTFTGRPHATTDESSFVWRVEAQDGATFHNRGVPAAAFRKGQYVVDEIRNYLASTGEPRIDIPSNRVITKRLTGDIKFGGGAPDAMTPLAAMRRAASLAGCQLFWTGGNGATMRLWPQPGAPLVEFTAELLQSEPKWAVDLSTLRNAWSGAGKSTLRTTVPATGPFSAAQMARGGKPWANTHFAEPNPALASAAALVADGQRRLNSLLTLTSTVTVELLPFWALDPRDTVRITSPYRSEVVAVRDVSCPVLGSWTDAAPTMSFGSLANKRSGGAGAGRTTGSAGSSRVGRKKVTRKKGRR